jgi:hypothetical protein
MQDLRVFEERRRVQMVVDYIYKTISNPVPPNEFFEKLRDLYYGCSLGYVVLQITDTEMIFEVMNYRISDTVPIKYVRQRCELNMDFDKYRYPQLHGINFMHPSDYEYYSNYVPIRIAFDSGKIAV